jgi:hypothetical protein
MTAYYSIQAGNTIKSGNTTAIMRNHPISTAGGTMYGQSLVQSKLGSRFQVEEQMMQKLEEIDEVESQIDWFERTRVDISKKPRYANTNLNGMHNYQEHLAAKLASKRQEQEKQAQADLK